MFYLLFYMVSLSNKTDKMLSIFSNSINSVRLSNVFEQKMRATFLF